MAPLSLPAARATRPWTSVVGRSRSLEPQDLLQYRAEQRPAASRRGAGSDRGRRSSQLVEHVVSLFASLVVDAIDLVDGLLDAVEELVERHVVVDVAGSDLRLGGVDDLG